MAFRIFISVVVLACAYFAFETVRLSMLQYSLLHADRAYTFGNPDGDLTFVTFLDYTCSYCQDADPVIKDAVAQDGNILLIPRPIHFSNQSDSINLAALPYAAAKQGKFAEMHDALIKNYRVMDDQVLQDIALEIGIDSQQLKEDLQSKDVQKMVETNMNLFKKYRLDVIPAYALGKNYLFTEPADRAFSVQEFLDFFKQARG